ncbi:odorant receptor 13a-like [Microplitis mediator]|uniref:odorant receptor 13a-like n=1 Tax=Microplitis mediator TaxID=375433 RepID=UPI0025526108|nr:odorant receptor 13a-like [Microplitis mediator]
MNTNVEKQFAEAKLLFDKVGWIIQFLSAWPLNPTYTKLILFLLYLIYENIYLLIAYNDFLSIFGDLQLMTTNLIGSLVQTIMMIRLIFVKFSKKVRNIIIEIQDDVCEKNYKNPDDKKIYVQYSSLAIKFYKVTMGFGTGAGLSFFILPLQNCILSWLLHKPVFLELPYRVKLFNSNETSFKESILLYIFEAPLPVTALCFFASVNMQFIIITNICARIAILTSRIKKVRGEVEPVSAIKHIVLKHLELIRLTKKVDEIWTPVFCVEIIVLIPLLALVMFSAILALEANETIAFMTLFTYVGAVLSCLFANCLMGELLLTEREQLLEAFYLCNWYKMSTECKRSWLICMVNCANIPMRMTAGKIYIFSFNGFTGILKSSMGYVSLLRTLTM